MNPSLREIPLPSFVTLAPSNSENQQEEYLHLVFNSDSSESQALYDDEYHNRVCEYLIYVYPEIEKVIKAYPHLVDEYARHILKQIDRVALAISFQNDFVQRGNFTAAIEFGKQILKQSSFEKFDFQFFFLDFVARLASQHHPLYHSFPQGYFGELNKLTDNLVVVNQGKLKKTSKKYRQAVGEQLKNGIITDYQNKIAKSFIPSLEKFSFEQLIALALSGGETIFETITGE